ncbi:hypothetical protein UFOVP1399_9 [uncultured Caudovirales phage]|uniref:Uncharacterized protein n=1 Tax=uncultured Caudovirales phage TaxID=2100421 RepID=A0A6J5S7N4_9CAUD|nr:hypothetical protein UFOVP1399_9 [uncultured Caudovirales phage]
MTKPIVKEHNTETGEIIEREMNAEELAQHEADAKAKADRDAVEAKAASDKAVLLDKLGITEEEASLLLS